MCFSVAAFQAGASGPGKTVGNCSLRAQAPDALALSCFEVFNNRHCSLGLRSALGRAGGHCSGLSVAVARDGSHGVGWIPESPAAAYSSFVLSSGGQQRGEG